ncbi:hypothetical protein DPMN_020330 [Dreissena polymorpha]|uniref:Uncharacterized protein n=1 Tax=Dreissena polymorpha TaxID=45954 RepID=A0A9D4NMF7_DREPO|nr:hypothetical protein DPMN_020330 [Dreissena polymorpha]
MSICKADAMLPSPGRLSVFKCKRKLTPCKSPASQAIRSPLYKAIRLSNRNIFPCEESNDEDINWYKHIEDHIVHAKDVKTSDPYKNDISLIQTCFSSNDIDKIPKCDKNVQSIGLYAMDYCEILADTNNLRSI